MANSGSNKVWSVVSLGTMHNRGSAVWEPTVPGAPTFVNPEGGETIYFTPSTDGGSEITNWYATISPDGPTLTLDTPDPANGGSVTISNYEWNTPYMLSVWAENEIGEGPPSVLPVEFIAEWNVATGGDVAIDHDYNGSGESWKIHTFTTSNASDGLNVSVAVQPFRVLVVAGGGGGSEGGGGGGAGGMLENESLELTTGDIPVTVGNGGALKANGQDSSLGSFLSCKGGGRGGSWLGQAGGSGGSGGSGGGGNNGSNGGAGGSGIAGQGHSGSKGNNYVGPAGGGAGGTSGGPSNGRTSTITGSSVKYAGGGGGGPWEGYGGPQGEGYGGGGGGGGYNNGGPQKGSAGKKGVVIVAYRIG